MDVIKSPRWTLEIMTWVGTLGYAQHYMGHLSRDLYLPVPGKPETAYSGDERVDVEYKTNATQAKALSDPDWKFPVGEWSTRFFSKDAVVEAAKKAFEHYADEGDWLINNWDDLTGGEPLVGTERDWESGFRSTLFSPDRPRDLLEIRHDMGREFEKAGKVVLHG